MNGPKLIPKTTVSAILAVMLIAAPAAAQKGPQSAQNGPNYQKQDFGFNDCAIDWGPRLVAVTRDSMVLTATEEGALGFTIHPSGKYGHVLKGSFPKGCRSPANLSWPLYLAEGHAIGNESATQKSRPNSTNVGAWYRDDRELFCKRTGAFTWCQIWKPRALR